MSNNVTTELRKMAAFHEARLKSNPDYIAWRALQEAIDKIEKPIAKGERIQAIAKLESLAGVERPKSQADAACEAIEKAGEPLTIHALIKALPEFGAEVGGKNKAVNLASNLSRSRSLHPVKWKNGKAWWFVDRQLPSGEWDDLLS